MGDKDRLLPTLSGEPLAEEKGERILLSSLERERAGEVERYVPTKGILEVISFDWLMSSTQHDSFLGDRTKKKKKTGQ